MIKGIWIWRSVDRFNWGMKLEDSRDPPFDVISWRPFKNTDQFYVLIYSKLGVVMHWIEFIRRKYDSKTVKTSWFKMTATFR